MELIIILVALLVIITMVIVGLSVTFSRKSYRDFSLRDILKENKKGENK